MKKHSIIIVIILFFLSLSFFLFKKSLWFIENYILVINILYIY